MPLNPVQPKDRVWILLDHLNIPQTKGRYRKLALTIEYFTKWTRVRALSNNTTPSTTISEHIITRFGCLLHITNNRDKNFVNNVIKDLMEELRIKYGKSRVCYSRPNGQVEATNQISIFVIHKVCSVKQDWEEELPAVSWAYKMTHKGTTRITTF